MYIPEWPQVFDDAPLQLQVRELLLIPVSASNPHLNHWWDMPNCRASYWQKHFPQVDKEMPYGL